jgi:nucleoside phosphorylase
MNTIRGHSDLNLARLSPAGVSASEPARSFNPAISNTPALPAVNWQAIAAQPPKLLATPSADLPPATAVVICWTDAEWAALEHVFCAGGTGMNYSSRTQGSWPGWQRYTKNLPTVSGWSYWGYYRLVQIHSSPVLLFKSNTHLDYPGQQYLEQLISALIATVKPKLILSAGTAGGARPTDHIGSVNVVRAATLYETGAQSLWPTYSNAWQADFSLIAQSGFRQLLFAVPTAATDLASLCVQFNAFYKSNFTLNTLNVDDLDTAESVPQINNLTPTSTSLLTADSFVVGTSSGTLANFACVEMDDAIIAKVCTANVAFGSVRNISDPIQNAALSEAMQAHWGQAIYDAYGFYTSYNGAIAAWALLAAQA